MNEILIILITFCSILLLFICGHILVKKASNLIVKVVESEYNTFGNDFVGGKGNE